MWLEMRDHQKTWFEAGAVRINWDAANEKNTTLATRIKFAASVVIGFYRKTMNVSNSIRFAKKASSHLKISELRSSPPYCYVARLGLITPAIGEKELQAARTYFEAKRDGISANVYARVLGGHPKLEVRASALPYAL